MRTLCLASHIPPSNQSGFALMLVLSVLILLGLLGSSFSAQVQVEIRSTAWLADQSRLQAAAQAGILYGLMQATHPNQRLRWRLDNQPHAFDWQGYPLTIRLLSERGRIDLNLAPRSVFVGLFKHLLPNASADKLADALIDWRDADDRTRLLGSELTDYQRAGRSYGPANRPFIEVAELAEVLGFNRSTLTKLRPYLTVHARRSRIDATAADVAVIAALPGILPSQAEQFVSRREWALGANQAIDFSLLSAAQHFIDTQSASPVLAIQVQINPANEPVYQVEAIIRLPTKKAGYQVLHSAQLF